MISAEEFADWKEHPVTKEIFADLNIIKDDIKDQLANGNTIGGDASATHSMTSRAVGQLDGINQLLNIHYDSAETQEEERVEEYDGYSCY